ncbi:MAG: sulfide/dihydroorotate dehydrogenase-like FAD/NAD-binding protein [Myxococcales bacterium]|jgi:NAD(P)H-flavin reductase
MYRIVRREEIAPSVTLFEVEAPRIAKRHRAGQFVMIRPLESSERIPLTVADTNPLRGTVTLVVQAIGKTTIELCDNLGVGDSLATIAGPLGNPTHLGLPGKPDDVLGTVVCVAGGIGAAPLLPIVRGLRARGHRVITILGARSANMLVLEAPLQASSSELLVCTDDGTRGHHGFVTRLLADLLSKTWADERPIDLVFAIGPPRMMQACSEATRPFEVPTMVSLNTVMVDGTGMCGGCRVTIGKETKYVCVDGPEFDGHQVQFDEMIRRQGMYVREESRSLELYREHIETGCRAVPQAAE